jgi:hypothetical protein
MIGFGGSLQAKVKGSKSTNAVPTDAIQRRSKGPTNGAKISSNPSEKITYPRTPKDNRGTAMERMSTETDADDCIRRRFEGKSRHIWEAPEYIVQ